MAPVNDVININAIEATAAAWWWWWNRGGIQQQPKVSITQTSIQAPVMTININTNASSNGGWWWWNRGGNADSVGIDNNSSINTGAGE